MGASWSLVSPQLAQGIVDIATGASTPYPVGYAFTAGDTRSFGFDATLKQLTYSTPFTLGVAIPVLTSAAAPQSTSTVLCTETVLSSTSEIDYIFIFAFTYYVFTMTVQCPIANSIIGTGPAAFVPYTADGTTSLPNTYALYVTQFPNRRCEIYFGTTTATSTTNLPAIITPTSTTTTTTYDTTVTSTSTTTLTGESTVFTDCQKRRCTPRVKRRAAVTPRQAAPEVKQRVADAAVYGAPDITITASSTTVTNAAITIGSGVSTVATGGGTTTFTPASIVTINNISVVTVCAASSSSTTSAVTTVP